VTRAADPDAQRRWEAHLRAADVQADLAAALARFLTLLVAWGGAVDLVASLEAAPLIEMVRESLVGLPWVPVRGRLLDVGSGNGFPGVPLLLARPGVEGVLLEPRERRWAFLREVVRELGLQAEVRRERLSVHHGDGYDVMTVRGVAAATWLADAGRVLRPDGATLWWTSGSKLQQLAGMAKDGRVLECPLPSPAIGSIAIWQRCST